MSAHCSSFYESLKSTPLAKAPNGVCFEEVMIWIDLNITSTEDLVHLLKEVDKSYHSLADVVEVAWPRSHSTSGMPYMSDRILYWVFNAIDKTASLDSIVCGKRFACYVKRAMNAHKLRMKSCKHYDGRKSHLSFSRKDADLYEVFAELNGIVSAKLSHMP